MFCSGLCCLQAMTHTQASAILLNMQPCAPFLLFVLQPPARVLVAETTKHYRSAALLYTHPDDVVLEVGCHEGEAGMQTAHGNMQVAMPVVGFWCSCLQPTWSYQQQCGGRFNPPRTMASSATWLMQPEAFMPLLRQLQGCTAALASCVMSSAAAGLGRRRHHGHAAQALQVGAGY